MKWMENTVKNLTMSEIMIFTWNNDFLSSKNPPFAELSSQNSYCIVWRCTLRYYPVVGWRWLHSNTIHRDIDKAWCCKNRVIAFLIQAYLHPVQISDLTSTKAIPNHFLHHVFGRWCQVLLQHLDMCLASHKCSSLWSKELKISLILPFLSITFFVPQSSSVQHVDFLLLCLEGQHPTVASSLLMLWLFFCGYHLMRIPVKDLGVTCFSN